MPWKKSEASAVYYAAYYQRTKDRRAAVKAAMTPEQKTEELRKRRARYAQRENKPEQNKEKRRQWKEANKERIAAKNSAYHKKFAAEQRERIAARRAGLRTATPKWANRNAMAIIYRQAKSISFMLGIEFHVDHVIPLKGKRVCGLHVENNLQIVPAAQNLRKSNSF